MHHPDELRHAAILPLRNWTGGHEAHWIRIVADQITGRRTWYRRPGRFGR